MKKIKKAFRRFCRSIRNIQHLFAKLIVAWCVGWGTACSIYAMRILSRTGQDAASLLAVILSFLGGELLFMCLRTVLKEHKHGKDEEEHEDL